MVFHARKVKHLLHKARQTARLGGNRLEMLVIRRIHAILHSLYGGEHCHQRRTKLMGNVGGQTALMLEILLKRSGHLVKRLTQLIDLVVATHISARGQIAIANLFCRSGDATNGVREHTGYK